MTADPGDLWQRRPLYGGILVGGASTRMGRPKALLRIGDVTLVERAVAVVESRVQRVVLLGGGPVPGSLSDLPRIPDVPGLAGPLAGMLAALRWAPDACWLIVACDLPLLKGAALDWLLAQRQPYRWVVLPRLHAGRVEPLLAVYEPEARALLETLIARGVHSPSSLDGAPGVYTLTPPETLCACWTNVNTPEELRHLGGEVQ